MLSARIASNGKLLIEMTQETFSRKTAYQSRRHTLKFLGIHRQRRYPHSIHHGVLFRRYAAPVDRGCLPLVTREGRSHGVGQTGQHLELAASHGNDGNGR